MEKHDFDLLLYKHIIFKSWEVGNSIVCNQCDEILRFVPLGCNKWNEILCFVRLGYNNCNEILRFVPLAGLLGGLAWVALVALAAWVA